MVLCCDQDGDGTLDFDEFINMMEKLAAVSRHDIAGIWVAFFQECQQHCCGQAALEDDDDDELWDWGRHASALLAPVSNLGITNPSPPRGGASTGAQIDEVSPTCCWLCDQTGSATSPLVRTCACGSVAGASSGYAHMSCLAEMAAQHKQSWARCPARLNASSQEPCFCLLPGVRQLLTGGGVGV